MTILIGSEQIRVANFTYSGTGTTTWKLLNFTREANNTTAPFSHDSGSDIYLLSSGNYAEIPVDNVHQGSGTASDLNGHTLKIGSEKVTVQSVTGSTLNVTRGQHSTTVAAHNNDVVVYGLPTTLVDDATILIGAEQMTVTDVDTATHIIGITRQQNGTAAVAHDNADNV